MPSFRKTSLMCHAPIETLDQSDYSTGKERTPSGNEVEVTRFSDGSSKVHFGGPCGSQTYDEYGEEC